MIKFSIEFNNIPAQGLPKIGGSCFFLQRGEEKKCTYTPKI